LKTPAEWTPSHLSFQTSPEGTNFYDLFNRDALEITFNVLAGTSIPLEPGWSPVLFLKVRSGSCDLAVPQEAERSIVVTSIKCPN
jgi:hypothetical protein